LFAGPLWQSFSFISSGPVKRVDATHICPASSGKPAFYGTAANVFWLLVRNNHVVRRQAPAPGAGVNWFSAVVVALRKTGRDV